jgi:hypothetical protein
MTEGIKDKVVIITGASSGLGQAAARRLAQKGAKLTLGARRLDRLQALAKELKLGAGAVAHTDVSRYQDVKRLVDQAVTTYGRIDVIVNNAGLMPLSPLDRLKIDDWDRMIDVNLKGVLYGIAAVLPHMKAQKSGHIINVSSVAGHKARQHGLFRDENRSAGDFRGVATGDQALQYPHHDHLAGRGRVRVARQRHRARRGGERAQGLRHRHPRRLVCEHGDVRHESAGRRRRQRDPVPADQAGILSGGVAPSTRLMRLPHPARCRLLFIFRR